MGTLPLIALLPGVRPILVACFIRRNERNMGTMPLMALLPGVRPILVATPWVLVPRDYKSTGHWLMVTGHRASDDRPTIIHVIFSGTQSGRPAVFRREILV